MQGLTDEQLQALLDPDKVREISMLRRGVDTLAILDHYGITEEFTAGQLRKAMDLGDTKLIGAVAMQYGIIQPPQQRVQVDHTGTVTHEHIHNVHEELLGKIDMVASNHGLGRTPRPIVRGNGNGRGKVKPQPIIRLLKGPERES